MLIMFLVGVFLLNFCLLFPTYVQNIAAFAILTFFIQEYKWEKFVRSFFFVWSCVEKYISVPLLLIIDEQRKKILNKMTLGRAYVGNVAICVIDVTMND